MSSRLHILFAYKLCPFLLLLFISGCDQYPGFKKTESGVYLRLDRFGDCTPSLSEAEFFIMDIAFKSKARPDTGYHFVRHHHALHANDRSGDMFEQPLMGLIDSMTCGDQITCIVPFSAIQKSHIGVQTDSMKYKSDEEMEMTLHIVQTFDLKSYCNYLMNAAQQFEMTETEAIELLLMNDISHPYEKWGDCYIQYLNDASGDSVMVGRDIEIKYNTYLFNSHRLDDTTYMQFSFGKPNQIIGGLQYALSLLQEHDHARIYLPSYLAFGENGNSVVAPHTPVFFDLEVINVITKSELVAKR